MKKALFLLLGLIFICITKASAYIAVSDCGVTGWQTYSNTFDESWTGKAGFLVSNYGDTLGTSVLLIDNLKGPTGNVSFESGDLTGYKKEGLSDVSVVTSYASYGGGSTISPNDGAYMAALLANGADTTAYGGTNGAILWITDTQIFGVGDIFSFDWNFLAYDSAPDYDFAMLLHTDTEPGVIEAEELAQIGGTYFVGHGTVVPEPATLSLLGLGLLGLLGFRKRKV